MKKLTYFIIFALLLTSCGSKEQMVTESPAKQAIINALNSGDSEAAEDLSLRGQQEFPEDQEYSYYLAQAYSQKAKIDIYSLFPLVKMQVFDLAISEWQQAKEYEKRQSNSVSLALVGNQEDQSKLSSKEALTSRIKTIGLLQVSDFELKYNLTYKNCYSTSNTSFNEETQETYDVKQCSFSVDLLSDHKDLKDIEMNHNSWISLEAHQTIDEHISTLDLTQYRRAFLYFAIEELNKRLKKIKKNHYVQKYIKGLYSLFDSVPILKAIPIVEHDGMKYIFKAIETLRSIIDNKKNNGRLKNNSLRQLGLLGGYLIAYSFKTSVDLESVENPIDIICKTNSSKVLENYPFLLTGIKTTLDVTINTEFYKKNQKNIDKAREYLNTFPDALTDESKEEHIDNIEDFKKDHC